MPRAKRPLAEVDGNAINLPPSAKRKSTGQEKSAEQYWSMNKARLQATLRDRDLPVSGNKDELISRLTAHYGETTGSKKQPKAASKAASKATVNAQPAIADAFEFITICRPLDDELREEWKTGQEIDDEREEEFDPKLSCGNKSCVCRHPVSENPDWPWTITKAGYESKGRLLFEARMRNQDLFGEYFYSHFNDYGFQEVVENQAGHHPGILALNSEFRKKEPSLPKLWALIEGLAFTIPGDTWYHMDDPARLTDTFRLLGTAVFSVLTLLEQNNLLSPESPVKNIALVLGCFRNAAEGFNAIGGEQEEDLVWADAEIEWVQKYGIRFKDVPFGIEDELADADLQDSDRLGSEIDKWKARNWATELKDFSSRHRTGKSIGGQNYSLRTAKERREQWRPWG
nr:hypothetical protein LTR18_008247 [Exophiala xenobiotica]